MDGHIVIRELGSDGVCRLMIAFQVEHQERRDRP